MVRKRSPDQTRRAILDAAIAEFAARGYAGGRIDAIAATAGINKRMLYHYFGSKEGLYAAVLDERLTAYAGAPRAESLAAELAARSAHARDRPDDLRLLMWEALTGAAPRVVGDSARRAQWRARVDAIEAAQRAGRIASSVEAAQVELALTALTLFPQVFRQIAELITGLVPGEPAFDAAHAGFLRALASRLGGVDRSDAESTRRQPDEGDRMPTTSIAHHPTDMTRARDPAPGRDATARVAAKPRVRLTAATVNRGG